MIDAISARRLRRSRVYVRASVPADTAGATIGVGDVSSPDGDVAPGTPSRTGDGVPFFHGTRARTGSADTRADDRAWTFLGRGHDPARQGRCPCEPPGTSSSGRPVDSLARSSLARRRPDDEGSGMRCRRRSTRCLRRGVLDEVSDTSSEVDTSSGRHPVRSTPAGPSPRQATKPRRGVHHEAAFECPFRSVHYEVSDTSSGTPRQGSEGNDAVRNASPRRRLDGAGGRRPRGRLESLQTARRGSHPPPSAAPRFRAASPTRRTC